MPKLTGVMALLVDGALKGFLAPRLAMDANLDLLPIVKDVTADNYTQMRPTLVTAIKTATQGKLAQDADLEGIEEVLEALEDNKAEVAKAIEADADDGTAPETDSDVSEDEEEDEGDPSDEGDTDATDPVECLVQFLKGKLSEEDMGKVMAIVDEDGGDFDEGEDGAMRVTRPAMDAAIEAAVRANESSILDRMRDIRQAEEAVAPFIGRIDGIAKRMTPSAIYKMALDSAGVELVGVPAVAYPAMVRMLAKPGTSPRVPVVPTRQAMDASLDRQVGGMLDGVTHIRKR